MYDGNAPPVYAEYRLKEKFGWTQAELEAESLDDIENYIKIMEYEQKRINLERTKNG